MATTVQDLLDDLLAGRLSLDDVAQEFAKRDWPSPSQVTDAQAWGVTDDDAPDPDSWAAVNACSRLSPEQYATLAAAAASKA